MKAIVPRRGLARPVMVACAFLLGAGVAVLSYEHALTVARSWGDIGRTAYLVPLLGDGLIVVCSAAMYEAAQATGRHSWRALAGLILGIAVTVALNVASGWHHGWATRCLNGLAPVVLLVAIDVVVEMYRRSPADERLSAEPASCGHKVATSLDEALLAAAGVMPQRAVADAFGVHRNRVGRLVRKASGEPAPDPITNGSHGEQS